MKDLYTYVLASFTPTDQGDIEADLIVNDEPMKFLQVDWHGWRHCRRYRGKKAAFK